MEEHPQAVPSGPLPKHSFFHTAVSSVVGNTHRPNSWWRYLVMFVAVLIGVLAIGSIMTFGIMYGFAEDPEQALLALAKAGTAGIDMSALGMPPSASLAMVVAPFACGLLVIFALTRPLHVRPIKSIITGASSVRWSRIAIGFGLWFGVSLLLEIGNYQLSPENYTFSFDPSIFWPAFIGAALLLPFQTSFEEVALRGYLMQGLGLATKSPFIALLLSSIAFGLLHFANPEVGEYGPMIMIYYIGTGLFLGLITIMDEGLELALGVHFANNLYAATIVSYPSSVFQYPSVYTMGEMNLEGSLLGWFIMAISMTLLFAFIFKWKNWKKIIQPLDDIFTQTKTNPIH